MPSKITQVYNISSHGGKMKLEVKNLTKKFGDKKVLKDLSFTVESGKAFGLLGRNGAGKTTTIRILMQVFQPTSGKVLLDGKPIDYSKVSLGYLPEERGLYPNDKIVDQLIYLAALKGVDKKTAIASIDYWLDFLQMTDYKNAKLKTLSKGNQQKIQLISCIVHNPDIVIFDEPFSVLDPVNSQLLEEVVREQIKRGKIVLFSSHQMDYVSEFCDDILILKEGEIKLQGNLRQILKNHRKNKLLVKSDEVEKIHAALPEQTEILREGELVYRLKKDEDRAKTMSDLIKKYPIDQIGDLESTLKDIFIEYAE